jgi:hypothetical protein
VNCIKIVGSSIFSAFKIIAFEEERGRAAPISLNRSRLIAALCVVTAGLFDRCGLLLESQLSLSLLGHILDLDV